MLVLAGILLVLGAVAGGYKIEQGVFRLLFQPAELIIIFGAAAVGTLVLGNPMRNVRALFAGLAGVLKRNEYTQEFYLNSLALLNELFMFGQRQGLYKLEPEIDTPEKSEIFKRHPNFLKKHYLVSFICDTLRVFILAGSNPADINRLMEDETEALGMERREPSGALAAMAEAFPGLGIVAAVLGIILTMGVISGPRLVIGERVASSLVGTFLGVLLSYGIFAPLAARMQKINQNEVDFCEFLRAGIASYTRGCSPAVALEFARRRIPVSVRPSFDQLEQARRRSRSS
jgi:chemotaxis protein MotA